jgi:hypothetical protein
MGFPDAIDRAGFSCGFAQDRTFQLPSTLSSQQAQKIGRIFKADGAFLCHRLTSVSQSCQHLPSTKEILFITCFKGDIFDAVHG